MKIIVKKRFIIVNNEDDNFIHQCDNELEAIELVKQDAILKQESEDYIQYMIIDLQSITPYFWKLGSLSEKRKPIFKIYDLHKAINL